MSPTRELTGARRATVPLLTVLGIALLAAFALAPAALLRGRYPQYQGEPELGAEVGRSFSLFWEEGVRSLPAELTTLVDYWFAWHAIKIVVSVLLVVVFGLLAAALWRRVLAAGDGRAKVAIGSVTAAVSTTALAAVSVLLAVLNVQATAVPLVALLPLLSGAEARAALGPALDEMTRAVADAGGSQAASPVLLTLLEQVDRYSMTMVVLASTLGIACGAASVALVRRYATTGRAERPRRVAYAAVGAVAAVTTTGLALLLLVAGTALADPSSALLDLLGV